VTAGTGGGSPSPTPSQTPSPTPSPSGNIPGNPTDLKVTPIWKGAEVSWKAPASDGGLPITGYVVRTPDGQTCETAKLTCSITGLKPGQRIKVSVSAKNAIGESKPPAMPLGPKVFTPLSLNLWQVKVAGQNPQAKPLASTHSAKLRSMLIQDSGGFKMDIRVAKNGSKFSNAKLQNLLVAEVKEVKAQLKLAGQLAKVRIESQVVVGSSRAKRPSVVLVATKP
jgi:hypothetical protein